MGLISDHDESRVRWSSTARRNTCVGRLFLGASDGVEPRARRASRAGNSALLRPEMVGKLRVSAVAQRARQSSNLPPCGASSLAGAIGHEAPDAVDDLLRLVRLAQQRPGFAQ